MKRKYERLDYHLQQAFNQSATGKGKERHANDDNWEDQKLILIPKLVRELPNGAAAPAYQAIKKIVEAGRLFNTSSKEAALKELYGAIVYTAAVAELVEQAGPAPKLCTCNDDDACSDCSGTNEIKHVHEDCSDK